MASGNPPRGNSSVSVFYYFFVLAVAAATWFAAVSFLKWVHWGGWEPFSVIGIGGWWFYYFDKVESQNSEDPVHVFAAATFIALLPTGMGWISVFFLLDLIQHQHVSSGVLAVLFGAFFFWAVIYPLWDTARDERRKRRC